MQLLAQSKNNVSALELKRHLGVCYRTAWLVKHKILEAMRLAEVDRQLTGRVEIDDAYLGGERSGGKTGRGSENKVPFVAAVQTTEDGRPHLVWRGLRERIRLLRHHQRAQLGVGRQDAVVRVADTKRIRCSLGLGTSAASRCMNSSGEVTRCVVPSRQGVLSLSTT